MSGVNSGNLAKLCEASMPKSCISRKHGICAFLEFADPSFTDQMSYVKNLFGFRAFLWYLTSSKNFMVICSAIPEILGGGGFLHPQMPVSCQKRNVTLTVK